MKVKEAYNPNTEGCPSGQARWNDGKCYPMVQASYHDLGEIPRLEDGEILIPHEVWSMEETKKMKVESAAEMSASEYAEFCKKNPNFPACLSETKKMEKELQELRSELQEINLLFRQAVDAGRWLYQAVSA